jgi:TM2 domain-containing membrane protein YozV
MVTSKESPTKTIMNTSNALAAIVNIFIPGVGQLIQGRVLSGLFFLIITFIGYAVLILPGIIMHIWAIVDAANYNQSNR